MSTSLQPHPVFRTMRVVARACAAAIACVCQRDMRLPRELDQRALRDLGLERCGETVRRAGSG
jgi:hypothetical protein